MSNSIGLTRRWFLIGTAAALAVAKIPPLQAVSKAAIVPTRDRVRWVYDICFSPGGEGDRAISLSVRRQSSGGALLEFMMSERASYRWYAPEGTMAELAIPDGDALRFEVAPDVGSNAMLTFISRGRTTGSQLQEVRWRDGVAEVGEPIWLDPADAPPLMSSTATPFEALAKLIFKALQAEGLASDLRRWEERNWMDCGFRCVTPPIPESEKMKFRRVAQRLAEGDPCFLGALRDAETRLRGAGMLGDGSDLVRRALARIET